MSDEFFSEKRSEAETIPLWTGSSFQSTFAFMQILFDRVKNEGRARRFLIISHDLIVTTMSFPIALLIRQNFVIPDRQFEPMIVGTLFIFLISLFVFRSTGIHQSMWRYASHRDLLKILQALLIIAVIFVLLMFFFDRLMGVARSSLIVFYLLAFVGLSSSRIIYAYLVRPNRTAFGHTRKLSRALLVGGVPETVRLAQAIHAEHSDKLQIVGVLGRRADIGREYHGMTVLGDADDLDRVLVQLDVRGVAPDYVIVPEQEPAEYNEVYQRLASIAKSHDSEVISSASLGIICRDDHGALRESEKTEVGLVPGKYHRVKRAVDLSIATAALLFLCPLLLLIACACLVFNGSPVFFRQVRVGRHRRDFSLLKFRTMMDPYDRKGRLLSDSERVSILGNLLRSTRLDELPQLWNVLTGNMALIGPRPLHTRDLNVEQDIIERRHSILPGLTGWAQVNGGRLLSSKQKMLLDLFYVENASISLDCRIIVMTIKMMIFGDLINSKAISEAEESVALSEAMVCPVQA